MSRFGKHRVAVWLAGKLLAFASALQNIPNKVTPPPFRLMQISSSYWQSRALYVAARLNIASVLGDSPIQVEALAKQVAAHPDALYRLLRMLTAMGIFSEVAPRRFANNPLSQPLRDDSPQSIRAMVLMHNSPEMSRPWFEQLENGVRSGEPPFVLSHGAELFDYMDAHPEFDKLFSQAMDSVEALAGDSYATDFDWSRFERLIDVGGSRGAKALTILKHHPQLHALVFDRPQVVAEAAEFLKNHLEAALQQHIAFEGGNMLESVPPARSARDVYLLSAVFHGIDDAACIQTLQSLANAIGSSGATVVLLEMVMAEQNADFITASFDMQMFMGTRGRERTLREWQTLFAAGGFALSEVVDLRTFGRLLVIHAQ
ncbi:MAG TPA: methyltransferase [Gammaproteobacteria bacterium]